MTSRAARTFHHLDPRRIHRAFSAAGVDLQPGERFLNSLENRVVRGLDREGRGWVGKFYRPGRWTARQVGEEHRFLRQLARRGLPVAAPLPVEGGPGPTVGRIAGIYFGIFPALPGRIPDEITWEVADAAGELLARIHQVGEREDFRRRPPLTPEAWALEPLAALEAERVVPGDLVDRYRRAADTLARKVAPLFRNLETLRLHGDFHRGNLLWSADGPSAVDFDDSAQGPPVHDLWLMVPGTDPEARGLREAMLEAYERIRPFERDTLAMIEPLRALRFVRYAAWVAVRRKDPAFVRAFPGVEEREHWEDEVTALETQVASLRL